MHCIPLSFFVIVGLPRSISPGPVTLPQFALSLALGILFAWAVVRICRWQQRNSQGAAGEAGEIPSAENCKTLTDLARHLIEVAKLAGGGHEVDLVAYAEKVLESDLGRDLAAARRRHLNRSFRMSALLDPSERTSLADGRWIANCPSCTDNSRQRTLRIHDRAGCFRCVACGAEGECFELIVLTAPNLRKFMEIQDLSYRRALLMFRFGLVVETAMQLICDKEPGEGGCGKLAPLQPRGPWRPRDAAPSSLEVAMRAHQDVPCSHPRKLASQPC